MRQPTQPERLDALTMRVDEMSEVYGERLDALEAVPVLTTVPSGKPWWQQYAKAVRGAVVAAIPTAAGVLMDGNLSVPDLLLILGASGLTGGVVAKTSNAPAEVDVERDDP